MQLKVKKTNPDGIIRLESGGEIKEILINEDFMHPERESVSICFRGKSSSGIIELRPHEIDKIQATVKGRMNLIKGIKKIR